jgi:ABC-type amino acid transport substrate-binding protein
MGAFDRDGKAAIVRCADRSKHQTLAQIDQQGVRVVVNPDGTNADFSKANIHHATIVNYPDNNTRFGQIVINKADVMITDASEIRWQTKQNPQLCGGAPTTPRIRRQVMTWQLILRRAARAIRSWRVLSATAGSVRRCSGRR